MRACRSSPGRGERASAGSPRELRHARSVFDSVEGRGPPHGVLVSEKMAGDELPGADARRKVADRWSTVPFGGEFSPEVYWLAVPEVQRHFQERACGGRAGVRWEHHCVAEFLGKRIPVERMLSIGCGSGRLERSLAEIGAFRSCEAFDVAPGALEQARRLAADAGFGNIDYQLRDLHSTVLPRGTYDAVWCSGSLHHIQDLEGASRAISAALRPGGYFFLNEYVGANRFDFPERQKRAIQAAFELIPPEYRISFFPATRGLPAERPHLPVREEVIAADPSEAVRSNEIVPVLRRDFEIVAMHQAGGSLLQFLLSGIAGNFREEDPDSMRILRMLMEVEDALIDSGGLESDFVVLAAKAKRPA